MISKIISMIMTILMMIFPFFQRIQPINDDDVAAAIILAVETGSVDDVEAFMCQNIKQNTTDLHEKLIELFACIDGEIITKDCRNFGGYSESDGNGKAVSQHYQGHIITTTTGKYYVGIVLETSNSFSPEERGIRSLIINDMSVEPSNVLYRIEATEGIMDMHN